jgi:tyrosine-protein phosphatase SIW14
LKALTFWRWLVGGALAFLMVAAPYVYYRHTYSHAKRLRVVSPGRVYRSGSMTAEGFRDAIHRLGIKTVLNLQEEAPDPNLPQSYFDRSQVRESKVCADEGADLVFLEVDTVAPNQYPQVKPAALAKFIKIMDDPKAYPILIHCRAGLHRTGVISAVYRMEYEGWTPQEALRELKDHGFGEFASTAANVYVQQYVLTYQPRRAATPPAVPGHLTSHPKE